MKKNFFRPLQMILAILLFIATSLGNLYAVYNGECWVVSNGDTIYKLYVRFGR